MKNVRPISMDQDPVLVIVIVSVSADVRTLIHQQHAPAPDAGQALRQDAACESSPYHQIIKHLKAPCIV